MNYAEWVADFNQRLGQPPTAQDAWAELSKDTERLAFLYGGTKTSSNALVNAELRLLNGETLTLDEARAAIDEAIQMPLAVAAG